jgi:hypothetical protein
MSASQSLKRALICLRAVIAKYPSDQDLREAETVFVEEIAELTPRDPFAIPTPVVRPSRQSSAGFRAATEDLKAASEAAKAKTRRKSLPPKRAT